ncbi:hypothetical protein HDU98_004393 [Podochytrium sp. JEL0797]|nr:hypothetical protein HDU98_004393 [Podochytrium sp. JEL0797]
MTSMLSTPPNALQIQKVSSTTLTINNTIHTGGVFLLNGTVLLWDVPQYGIGLPSTTAAVPEGQEDDGVFLGWTKDCFGVLAMVHPMPEIVVVGTGAQMQRLPVRLREYLGGLGCQVERHAASTYNLLIQEGRKVAAALLPVIPTSARTGLPLVTVQSGKRPDAK